MNNTEIIYNNSSFNRSNMRESSNYINTFLTRCCYFNLFGSRAIVQIVYAVEEIISLFFLLLFTCS